MRAAWCSECGRYVELDPSGQCGQGHPRSSLRNVHEVGSSADIDALQPSRTSAVPQAETSRAPLLLREVPPQLATMLVTALVALVPTLQPFILGERTPPYLFALMTITWLAAPAGLLYPVDPQTTPSSERNRTRDMALTLHVAAAMTTIPVGIWAYEGGAGLSWPILLSFGIWLLYASFIAIAQPWRDEDILGPRRLSIEGRARRRRAIILLSATGTFVPIAYLAALALGRQRSDPLLYAAIASVAVFAACLLGLQLLWEDRRLTLIELRRRLALSRPLMFTAGLIGSAYLIAGVVLVPLARSRFGMEMLIEGLEARDAGKLLLIAIPMVALAAWAAFKLAPVGGLRWLGGRRVRRSALATLGAVRLEPGHPLKNVAEAMERTQLALGLRELPPVYVVTELLGLNAYVMFQPHGPVLLLTRTLATNLSSEDLVAVFTWLMLRSRAGVADWWNERAVESVIDQETMHLMSGPAALVSALGFVGKGAGDPASRRGALRWALAPFAGRPEANEARLRLLRASAFDSEYVPDPLDWNNSIPKPVQDFFDAWAE